MINLERWRSVGATQFFDRLMARHRRSPLWDEARGQSQPPLQVLGCAFGVAPLPAHWNCEAALHCGLLSRDGKRAHERSGARYCESCIVHWNGPKPWVARGRVRNVSDTTPRGQRNVVFADVWARSARLLLPTASASSAEPRAGAACAGLGIEEGVAQAEQHHARQGAWYTQQELEVAGWLGQ